MMFYVATGLENASKAWLVCNFLTTHGHNITYNWMRHGSVQDEDDERIAQVAKAELCGVRDADFVVVLLPGGRGTHTELGAALALGKPVLLYASEDSDLISDGRICSFYLAPGVRLSKSTIADFLLEMHHWVCALVQPIKCMPARKHAFCRNPECKECYEPAEQH